ncbi:MAG: pectate lyase, partial [Flavisolibacter sp.]
IPLLMMIRFHLVCFVFIASCMISCAQQKKLLQSEQKVVPVAFPGAEGFGKYTTGGRGGKVVVVSNLNDKGPGSFREAVQMNVPRIVVFAVSGTIHLESQLNIKSDVTIAGQTAPGDGICLADEPVVLSGNNIIVRYLRFRMGDKNQKGGMVDGNGGDDAFGGTRRKNIIVDHCSMSWSTDEVFSVYGGDSTTLQWNLISEPLNYSYHFEAGDKDYEHHGFGAIWGGRRTSAHHNLFAHCANRTPRFDGERNIPEEFVDFRNNVIYDWLANNVYAGEGGNYNIVNNYYKYGPSTHANARSRVVNPYKKLPKLSYGKFFVDGNYIDGDPDVTKDNWKGVTMNEGTEADIPQSKMDRAFDAEPVATQPATKAYELVLQQAGASYQRDTLDQRIVNDVKNRTGRLIDVQGGYPHGTEYEQTLTAWPTLKTKTALADSDGDGMPDSWEKSNGLNPNDASDASQIKLHSFYTNIEMYINSIK